MERFIVKSFSIVRPNKRTIPIKMVFLAPKTILLIFLAQARYALLPIKIASERRVKGYDCMQLFILPIKIYYQY